MLISYINVNIVNQLLKMLINNQNQIRCGYRLVQVTRFKRVE